MSTPEDGDDSSLGDVDSVESSYEPAVPERPRRLTSEEEEEEEEEEKGESSSSGNEEVRRSKNNCLLPNQYLISLEPHQRLATPLMVIYSDGCIRLLWEFFLFYTISTRAPALGQPITKCTLAILVGSSVINDGGTCDLARRVPSG